MLAEAYLAMVLVTGQTIIVPQPSEQVCREQLYHVVYQTKIATENSFCSTKSGKLIYPRDTR